MLLAKICRITIAMGGQGVPNRNYRNGRALEYRVKKWLEADNWFVVRSSGSHGIADLISVKKGKVCLIQCKTNGHISVEERRELIKVAKSIGAIPMLASTKGGMHQVQA